MLKNKKCAVLFGRKKRTRSNSLASLKLKLMAMCAKVRVPRMGPFSSADSAAVGMPAKHGLMS